MNHIYYILYDIKYLDKYNRLYKFKYEYSNKNLNNSFKILYDNVLFY